MDGNQIEIGDWTAIPELGTLTRGDVSKSIGPRAMDLLIYLSRYPGRVFSTQELISAVWKGVVVTDASVYLAIKQLRDAFEDRHDRPCFIDTIPRRGYRLVAPVRHRSFLTTDDSAHSQLAGARKNSRYLVAALICCLLAGLIVVAALNSARSTSERVASTESAALARPNTISPEAEALFLRAKELFFRNSSLASIVALLDRAIVLDPDFVEAYHLRADARFMYRGFLDRDEATEAILMNPSLAEAQRLTAWLHDLEGNSRQAEQVYKSGSRIHPSNSDILGNYSRLLRSQGRASESIKMLEEAIALNAYDFDLYHQLGISYRAENRFDESVDAASRAIALAESNPITHLGLAYTEICRRNFEVAVRELRLAEKLGADTWFFRVPQMAYAYSRMGLKDDVSRLAKNFVQRAATGGATDSEWAILHLAAGDVESAFQRFEAAVENQGANRFLLTELKLNTYQNPVLDQARFVALREQVGSY